MSRGSFEAGGALATPADRDNTDSFSQLIDARPSYEDNRFLTKMIQDLHRNHPDLIGLDKIENGMRLLVTALTELRGIDPANPDARMRISKAELKEGQLIQYLKEQMAHVNHYTINDDNELLALERDFMTFMESYRVRKIQVIQTLNQLQFSHERKGLSTGQTTEMKVNQDHEGELIYDEPAPTGMGKRVIQPDPDDERNGSCMDIESLDDGYMQATNAREDQGAPGTQVHATSLHQQTEFEDWDPKSQKGPFGALPSYSENGHCGRDQHAISDELDQPGTLRGETGARKREGLHEVFKTELKNLLEVETQPHASRIDEEKLTSRVWTSNGPGQIKVRSNDEVGKEGSWEDANKRGAHRTESEGIMTGVATSPTNADHPKILRNRQQQNRDHWDVETRKIMKELQQLRQENERLRKAEAGALARQAVFEDRTDEQSLRSSKPLQMRMQGRRSEERSRESLKQELRNEFSNLLETRLHSYKADLGNIPQNLKPDTQVGGKDKAGENPNLGIAREEEGKSQVDALVRFFENKFSLIQERLSNIEKQSSYLILFC